MNADGTGRSVLAGTGVDAAPVKMGSSSPVWSPSGTMLACWLGDRLIVVNANGKGERTVARVPYRPGSLIAWQPVAA